MATRTPGKPLLFLLCLAPLVWLVWRAVAGDGLGANPVEVVNRYLGDWALRFLLITLAVTPLARLTGRTALKRYRRMLGLFAFAYAALHVVNYAAVDQALNGAEIWADLLKRRFITIGMAVFCILAALAATTPKAVARRLGGRRWRLLHRTVYVAAVGAVAHYAMMVKADPSGPFLHGALLALLLLVRFAPVVADAKIDDQRNG